MAATITKQMLIDAITLPGVKPVGTTDPNLLNPRYAEMSAGTYSARLTPGTVETSNGSKLAAGLGPWIEVSSMVRLPVAARLNVTGHLYSLSKRTGTWTERVAWGGSLGWAKHLFSWGNEHGNCTDATVGPAGWGSTDGTWKFGDNDNDPQVPAGQAFVRVHGWPMSWTGTNGFFWLSVDPNSDKSAADPAKVSDLAGVVQVLEVAVTGTQAAQARYAISHGWDTYWQGAATTGLSVGTRTGSGSGFREVTNGSVAVCSTLSRAQIDTYGPALPGWAGTTTPPPPPPPPPADVKHKVRTCLEVDGVQTWTPMVDV